jgi:hypothetical protein
MMITKAIILKDGERFADVDAQSLLPEEVESDQVDNEDTEYLLASGGAIDAARTSLHACFSEILGGDIDVLFPELGEIEA